MQYSGLFFFVNLFFFNHLAETYYCMYYTLCWKYCFQSYQCIRYKERESFCKWIHIWHSFFEGGVMVLMIKLKFFIKMSYTYLLGNGFFWMQPQCLKGSGLLTWKWCEHQIMYRSWQGMLRAGFICCINQVKSFNKVTVLVKLSVFKHEYEFIYAGT